MSNWKAWVWPGVVTVVILTALSVWFRAADVQSDLVSRAHEKLGPGHQWVEIKIEGRDLHLTGTSPSPEAREAAIELASKITGIRTLVDETILPDIANPFVFAISKRGEKINLSGNIQSEQERELILSRIGGGVSGAQVTDGLVLARGAPTNFSEVSVFLTDLLPDLETAELKSSGNSLELRGSAAGLDEYENVIGKLTANFPTSFELVSQQIKPPTISPYRWSVDYNGTTARIEGLAPNFDARSAIVLDIKNLLPKAEFVNEMRIAAGAPAEYKTATDFATGILPLLDQGRVALADNGFLVSGVAKSPEDFEEAEYRLGGIPAGYTIVENALQPASVSPFSWHIAVEEQVLTLDGYATSSDMKRQIVVAAMNAFPNVSLVDNLRIAGGASDAFSRSVELSFEIIQLLDAGEAVYRDGRLRVSGFAKTAEAYGNVLELIERSGSGVEISNLVRPPEAIPYRWTISKTAHGITLRGNVSSPEDAQLAMEDVGAAFPLAAVSDRQEFASGQPLQLPEVRKLLSMLLTSLEAGQGNVVDNTVSIVGRATSEAIARKVDTLLKDGLPSSFFASTNILWPTNPKPDETIPIADPYRWSISKLPDEVTVLGNVSDQADRLKILNSVRKVFSVTNISDRQIIARGEPEKFDEVRMLLIRLVSFLDAGQANIIGNKVAITGRAKNANFRRLIERTIRRDLPLPYTETISISVPISKSKKAKPIEFKSDIPVLETAKACEEAIVNAVNDRKIQFETASANITSDSGPVLHSVAEVAKSCPDFQIEVVGHTDSKGRDRYNQRLSELRAQAVVNFLATIGVSKDRMIGKGLGETEPVASNDAELGRALNRRIEFKVREQ